MPARTIGRGTALFFAAALTLGSGCAIGTAPGGWGGDGASLPPNLEPPRTPGVGAEAGLPPVVSGGDGDAGATAEGGGEGPDAAPEGSPESGAGDAGGGPPDAGTGTGTGTGVLVFAGDGTWGTEVGDLEDLLTAHAVPYQEVTSAQLDAMSVQDMAKFAVIYIPGGEGGTEAADTSSATHANLRAAVQQLGVSYVGFCAGAFVAVAPAPPPGGDVSYGFGVVDGPVLDYYTGPGSDQTYAMTMESYPDGTSENILWYGGPVTPAIGVVARYPTGDPAISQIRSGNGLVLIGGVHPDLSQGSLDALGVSPDTPSQDIAWKILNAALTRQPLPTFP